MSKKLKAKLDRIFSEYIRMRDSYTEGGGIDRLFICISCDIQKVYSEADCGHFYGRANMTMRYDEENCNAQCVSCNQFKSGNPDGYKIGLKKKYGEDILEELQQRSIKITKLHPFEYEDLINKYQQKLKEL